MTLVDVHQHLWPARLRAALAARSEPPYLRGETLVLPVGGVSVVDPSAYGRTALVAALDAAGIGAALVSLPPTLELTEPLVELWHEGALAAAAASQGRLVPLAYRTWRPGFAGAIVSGADLADLDALAPLLDELQDRGKLLFVHPGPAAPPPGAPPWWSPGIAYTAELQAAYAGWVVGGARRWPHLQIVFALLAGGAPFQVERLVRRGLDPRAIFAANVHFDTSSYGPRALDLALATFGADRLVFGSDAPVDPIGPALAVLDGFGEAFRRRIAEANPTRLLGLEEAAWAA